MSYGVMMTNSAIEQTREIIAYIAEILMVPEAAQRWKARLKAEMQKLTFMPNRIPLTEEEPWRSRGIHRLVVENFLVYFWIDEGTRTVWITGVVYSRRDRLSSLIDMQLQ